jgi:hypothetical protein
LESFCFCFCVERDVSYVGLLGVYVYLVFLYVCLFACWIVITLIVLGFGIILFSFLFLCFLLFYLYVCLFLAMGITGGSNEMSVHTISTVSPNQISIPDKMLLTGIEVGVLVGKVK